MVYYLTSAASNAVKYLLGYQNASAQTGLTASSEPAPRSLSNEELSQLLAQVESRRTAEASQPEPERDGGSIRSVPASIGNGVTKKHGHAILRGSPQALGWAVDKEEEDNAWVILMGDAMDGAVYESQATADDEGHPKSPVAPSNQDITKFFSSEKERGISYIWSIMPSLKGAHQWILRRQVDPEAVPPEPEVIRQEMQTDTMDLVEQSHKEIATQTVSKTYCDAGVQVDEPAHVPNGALPPLPESSELVDILPSTFPRSESPVPSTTAIESPNSSSRIPRLGSRKNSVASFASTSTRAISPTPNPAQPKGIRPMSSIRSIALKRASSFATRPGSGPALTAPAVNSTGQASDADSETKASSGRFFNAVKRMSRADSVMRVWKP